MATVLPLAWLSWELVERRAIGLELMRTDAFRRRMKRRVEFAESQEVVVSR